MLKNPATDEDLLKVFKAYNDHSQAAAIRALYDRGASDMDRQFFSEIMGDNPPPDDVKTGDGFIHDEFGAAQPLPGSQSAPSAPKPSW